jgi:hypothetical protein
LGCVSEDDPEAPRAEKRRSRLSRSCEIEAIHRENWYPFRENDHERPCEFLDKSSMLMAAMLNEDTYTRGFMAARRLDKPFALVFGLAPIAGAPSGGAAHVR